jgi:hypothetical protein
MKLTEIQLRSLKLLQRHRSRPLTAMDFFKESWRKYALALVLVTGAIVALAVSGVAVLAVFLGGYLLGVLERDILWVRNEMRVLPLSSEITNWERVEQLIQENEPPNA